MNKNFTVDSTSISDKTFPLSKKFAQSKKSKQHCSVNFTLGQGNVFSLTFSELFHKWKTDFKTFLDV